MINFIGEFNDSYNKSIYYGDAESLYTEKKYWDVLDKANLVGKELGQGKSDYKTVGISYGLFLAPKRTYVLTIDEFGIIHEHKTFKAFNDSKRLLDRSQYFKMLDCYKISAMVPKSWNKSFENGINIATKMRFCNDCNDKAMCNRCYNQINENKEFEANSILLKRQAPNEFGHTFLCFKK